MKQNNKTTLHSLFNLKNNFRVGDSAVEYLPNVTKVLGLIHSTTYTHTKIIIILKIFKFPLKLKKLSLIHLKILAKKLNCLSGQKNCLRHASEHESRFPKWLIKFQRC
jgi:hypothetical protein